MEFSVSFSFTLLIIAITRCNGDHFRGGTISWKPTGNSREVEFTYKFGLSYSTGNGCTPSLVGSYVSKVTFRWACTSGCTSVTTLSSAGYTCTAASITQDWEQGEYSFKYTFSSDGQFTVSHDTCCWINLDYGTSDRNIRISTTVDLRTRSDIRAPNTCPISASKPIYTVKFGCTQKIKLPVIDEDGDNIRCRWAAGGECRGACNAIPNTVLDENNCTLTISATQGKGDTYAVALMVEDRPRSTITLNGETFTPLDVLSSIPLQFLVSTPEISLGSCSDKPVFVNPTPEESEVIVISAGTPLFVDFYATSGGTSIDSFLLIGPPNLKQSSIRQLSLTPDVYSIDVTWNTTVADKGSHSLCVEATDANQISSDLRCVIIKVLDVHPCEIDPCKNCGTCTPVGSTDDFSCSCAAGFTGTLCEIDIDECSSVPCQNKGTCTDLVDGFYCTCPAGFEGRVCEIDINECSGNQCQNGGTCHDLVNTYLCTCQPGYTDVNCEIDIDECISRPCLNNGMCIEAVNTYSCTCSPGFTGIICETDIDECESAPCFNNGTCHDKINGYTCQCKPGYTGTFCEIDIDECASDPCFHNGICFNLVNSFFCGCSLGYTGDQCEIDIDECEDEPCIHGGNCTDLLGGFYCDCLPGFTGKTCQIGLDPCSSMPCKNDAFCVAYNSTYYTCKCVGGWDGIHCAFRQQNESFYNSSIMTNSHMQYSECSCLLGNINKQHCYKYKTEKGIGYGIIGALLGLLTVVGFYLVAELCLNKSLSGYSGNKVSPDTVTKEKDVRIENIEENKKDVPLAEEDIVDEKAVVPPKVKPHIAGNKHRTIMLGMRCEI